MFDTYWINLTRRSDRRAHCEKQFREHAFDMARVFRYEAKDAHTYMFSDDEKSLFEQSDFRNTRFAPAIMCNFLSHMDLWKQVANGNAHFALIMQDDVVLRHDFMDQVLKVTSHIPHDAEVIWLGTPQQIDVQALQSVENNPVTQLECGIAIRVMNTYVACLNPMCNPCSVAYILTKDGARKLIDHTLAHGVLRATDGCMNDYLESKGIHYVSRTALVTHDIQQFGSDIFV